MAIRFARQAGNWSNPLTWDGGLTIPTTGDDVYSNGFTVTLNQDVNVGCLNGGTCPQGVPLSPIPNMTNNTTPAGVGQAFASSNSVNAWQAFKKPITNFTNTGWQPSGTVPQQLGFQFNNARNIQRYSWYTNSNANQRPRNWTFEGSNDGVTYVVLHTVTAYANTGTYFSPVISNPSSYLYYRINVTAVQSGTSLFIDYLDMTESTDLGNGYGVNGQFNSNVNRTITCTSFGIVRTFGNTVQVVNIGGSNTTTTITGNIVQYINNNVANGVVTVAGGTNTVNITGDVYIDSLASIAQGRVISSDISTNVINIVGNVYSYSTDVNNMRVILHQNILNITGNVTNFGGANTTINSTIAGNTVTSVHNITGNIIGPTANGGYCVATGELNLTGNLTCTAGIFPISVNRFRISPSTSISFRLQDTTNANRFMYTDAQNIGQAAEADVRDGTVYGPNNDYTGTCAVPPANAVSVGVPVDNTVGTASLDANALAVALDVALTASLTPALTTSLDASLSASLPTPISASLQASLPAAIAPLLWDEDVANITTPNSIGERLKNCATVATTGAQISSFNP